MGALRSPIVRTITHLDLTACTYKEMFAGCRTRASPRPWFGPLQTAGPIDPERHLPQQLLLSGGQRGGVHQGGGQTSAKASRMWVWARDAELMAPSRPQA